MCDRDAWLERKPIEEVTNQRDLWYLAKIVKDNWSKDSRKLCIKEICTCSLNIVEITKIVNKLWWSCRVTDYNGDRKSLDLVIMIWIMEITKVWLW